MKVKNLMVSVILIVSVMLNGIFMTSALSAETVVVDENFDSCTSVDDLYENRNWSPGWAGMTGVELNSDGDNKYVMMESGKTLYRNIESSSEINSGKYRVSWYVRPKDTEGNCVIQLQPDSGDYSIPIQCYKGEIFIYERDTKYVVSNYVAGEWYEISAVLNFDEKNISVRVSNNGNVLGSVREKPMYLVDMARPSDDHGYMDKLALIRFQCWYSGGYDIDNLKIESISKLTDSDLMIISENFENITIDDTDRLNITTSNGWLPGGVDFGTSDVSASKTLKMTTHDTMFAKSFSPLSGGKYKISYSVYFGDSMTVVSVDPSTSEDGMYLTYITPDGKIYRATTESESWYTGKGNIHEWNTIECIVDMDKETIEYTIMDKDGNRIDKPVTVGGFRGKAWPYNEIDVNSIGTFMVRAWSKGGKDTPTDVYLDDFSLSHYIDKPSLDSKSVKMTDSTGNDIDDTLLSVPTSVKTITLDFGCNLDIASLEGALNITDSDGTAVPFTYIADGQSCVITLSSLLKPESEYTLTVLPIVKNTNDDIMQAKYVHKFTTGKSQTIVKLKNITVNGENVTTLNDIEGGDKISINTSVVNQTTDAKDLIWLIAYYDGNALAKVERNTAVAVSGTREVEAQTFTVPNDLSNITEVRVFLWNTLTDMIAYCEPIVLNR